MRYIDPDGRFTIGDKKNNNTYVSSSCSSEAISGFIKTGFEVFNVRDSAARRLNAAENMARSTNDIARDDNGNLSTKGTISAYNNRSDAWRHFTWNAEMTKAMGADKAKAIADNHEVYGNVGYGGDNSSKMDLWNNSVGRVLATVLPNKSPEELFTIAEKYGLTVESTGDSRLQEMTNPTVFNNGNVVIPFPIIEALQNER